MKNNRREFLQKIGLGTAGIATVPFAAQAAASTQSAADGSKFSKSEMTLPLPIRLMAK